MKDQIQTSWGSKMPMKFTYLILIYTSLVSLREWTHDHAIRISKSFYLLLAFENSFVSHWHSTSTLAYGLWGMSLNDNMFVFNTSDAIGWLVRWITNMLSLRLIPHKPCANVFVIFQVETNEFSKAKSK